jgi:hypothetical protein
MDTASPSASEPSVSARTPAPPRIGGFRLSQLFHRSRRCWMSRSDCSHRSQKQKIDSQKPIAEAEMQNDTSELDQDTSELDQMQTAYKTAVEQWLTAIKEEEALASVNHTIAEVDKWEGAHFAEDELRNKVKAAKKKYEDALREKFFGF